MPRGNHDTGKKGESETWSFLLENGFVRPTKDERRIINQYYQNKNILLDMSGYDVIRNDQRSIIGKEDIILYEVKTTGIKRGVSIGMGFSGLGFTLTEKEYDNAIKLANKYLFIFVNLYTRKYIICKLEDFFDTEKSRIYKTWSVFVKENIIA